MRRLFFLAFLLCLFVQEAGAQLIMRRTSEPSEFPPKALIILLPYGKARIDKMREIGREDLANQLKTDLEAVRALTVEDFNDYFTYCPYYFVADTNIDRLADKEYAGILLDSMLQPVANPVITAEDSTQMIAYFGYRARDKGETVHTITGSYTAMYNGDSELMLHQMVFLDHRLRQLNRPLPRTPAGYFPRYALKKPRYQYRYVSKVFDVTYKLTAPFVSSGLKNFYGAYPYQNAQ